AWRMGAAVKQLFDNGTSVQVGAHGQLYGIDTHWELDLLVRSGFTPAQALEAGTIRGAWYHGLDQDLGSLEPGKLADLVVLDANPLTDIANAQRIRFVMKNGVLYDGANAARIWPDPRPAAVPYFAPRP
ncbi:MAG TPA: amidohydrolase family protein, partial [Candidatus Melainabacteria bacterium]|nr:amidohydrolase family protein [Candidatus Melainabacteria bacterium]